MSELTKKERVQTMLNSKSWISDRRGGLFKMFDAHDFKKFGLNATFWGNMYSDYSYAKQVLNKMGYSVRKRHGVKSIAMLVRWVPA